MPRSIYRSTPLLLDQVLHPPGASQRESVIPVDSPEWFRWLETGSRFAYRLELAGWRPHTITFRSEKKQRGGTYWSAYMKDQLGKLHKLYAGKLAELTWERISHILDAMREKLTAAAPTLSYPTHPAAKEKQAAGKQTQTLPALTAQDVAQFHRYDALLTFCSEAFEQRWGHAWRWENGKIYRNTFDKYYYVMDQSGEQKHILGKQRYFVVVQLLHWVNHGYDEGYNDKLSNT
ncbi:MAG: hypothetical protein IAE80_07795 [Anaerolinea sp.]|nr:hypothetical protein [Anaerolinea sp.]